MNQIPLNQINIEDKRFCISFPLFDKALHKSVAAVGIVEPAVLTGRPPYVVVSGHKRLEVAAKLGMTAIPAMVQDMDERQALLAAIHSNLGRVLNAVEKALAAERMLHLGFSREEVFAVMEMADVPPKDRYLDLLIGLANSEQSLREFIVRHSLSMATIELLLRFTPEERTVIEALFSSLHTTEGGRREVLQLLNLMKVKRSAIDMGALKDAATLDEVKRVLKHTLHPLLTGMEARLLEIRGKAALPPSMDIRVDPFFEKEYIDIAFRARTETEITDALGKLHHLLQTGHIRSIFELTKGQFRRD